MQLFNYIEIAKRSPRNRGLLIPVNELKKHLTKEPLYRSIYMYDSEAKDFSVSNNNSLRNYYGERSIDSVIIDIDKKENSDEYTLKKCQSIVYQLTTDYDLQQFNFRVFFSGSGYHIHIPNAVFNFTPGVDLPFQVRETLMRLFPDADPMIYMRTGLYRVPHSLNTKTNLYKIPLEYNEVMGLKWEEIHQLARTPRTEFPYAEVMGDGEMEEFKVEKIPRIRQLGKVMEPKNVATCIQTMYNNGATEGSRHHTMLRIVSHFRRNGIPSDATKAALLEWNNGQLRDQEVIDQVEYSYNKGYKYGCNDELMTKFCNPKCIYYKRKDYSVDVMNASEMQKELDERLTTDFTGKSFNLAKALGVEVECVFYPGDLVTIFGPTGSSKTTLAHNIALGYNHLQDTISHELQVPTLYLSLELAAWYMHRRSLQIVSGKSKKEVTADYNNIYKQCENHIGHMAVQTVPPTLDQIQQKIKELQPSMVIVDYIDLVETPPHIKGEYEQIKYISHGLSNMAVNNDLIIVQISQVSREYSRNEVLDLYAGKGSGAIENASRKVIGLQGQANTHVKKVKLFKNTDGELFDTQLEWTPSFRLRRSNGY